MILFVNRVFIDIIKLGQGHAGLEWALNPVRLESLEEEGNLDTETDTQKRRPRGDRQWSDAFINQRMPRIVLNHPKLEESREGSSSEPSGAVWPCQHLDFGCLASRMVR